LDGNNVKIDGFGTFSIHASGIAKEHPEEVSAHDITKLKLAYLPDKKIKKELKKAEFYKK
jgi:nucleoid DNA-binding protein